MNHFVEIAYRVVIIMLGIIAQSLKITLLRGADKRKIPIITVPRREGESRLADMFPPCGVGQPVERIVSVMAGRVDLLAIEDGLERSVFNAGNVARRIIGTMQILHRCGVLENL